MTIVARVFIIFALLGFVIAGAVPATAQGTQFSLGVGQSATAGSYTIVFRGFVGRLPAYDLYFGSVLAARFPSTAPRPNPGEYLSTDGKVSIVTVAVAPDGSAVSGTLTVR